MISISLLNRVGGIFLLFASQSFAGDLKSTGQCIILNTDTYTSKTVLMESRDPKSSEGIFLEIKQNASNGFWVIVHNHLSDEENIYIVAKSVASEISYATIQKLNYEKGQVIEINFTLSKFENIKCSAQIVNPIN